MGNKSFPLRLTEDLSQYVEEKAKSLDISRNDYIKSLIMVDRLGDKQEKILNEVREIKEMLEDLKN